jgi:alkylation response protein AidB-like acyl-CoA dehydrogenase
MIDSDNVILTERDKVRIGRAAAAAEACGFLHPVQQAMMHRRGWLRMLAPRASGGGELPLPQVVRLEEAVAAVDGSMGWVLTLCAGAGWFAGFLPPAFARTIMATPHVCLGGSGAPTGHAEREGDGYRITGSWDYASGAPMATHFTLNAVLREGGAPRIRAFLVPAAQVQVVPTWRSVGLRASASHGYRIDAQWVSEVHGFTISPAAATCDGPLYRYPFYALAYVTLAANMAGMAAHFLALAQPCMARRRHAACDMAMLDVPEVATLVQARRQAFAIARDDFYQVLDASWASVAGGAVLGAGEMAAVQRASLALVTMARAAVDELYPYCGLYAAREDSVINRVWRDFHTASQHSLLLP